MGAVVRETARARTDPLRVLIVEDSEDDQLLLIRHLRQAGFDLTYTRVDTPEGLAAALKEKPWDIVISDFNMPRFSGIAALELTVQHDPDLPFILMSGAIGEETAVAAMKAGAHDYIMKDNLTRLVPAVQRGLHDAEVQRARRVAEAALRESEELQKKLVSECKAQMEASNRELEAFAYAVAHDLRQPLRGLDGFSQILLEDYAAVLDAEGQEYLRRIRRGTMQMDQLITDLLVLSRITRRHLHRTPTDLSHLARTVAERLQKTAPDRHVTMCVPDDLVAEVDPPAVQVMLEYLLGNAWKFTQNHSSAQIEFGMTEQDGESVYFVRDDGAGFDMRHADKLFGPFSRLHSPGEFHGNGIGLATVQRLVRMHGGRIWAEGAVEQGATFYFTLGPASWTRFETQAPEHAFGTAAAMPTPELETSIHKRTNT